MEGFRHKRKCKDLLGCEASDWRSFVELYAPDIKNLREVVCLGNRYIVSLGAHSHPRFLLMDRAHADPLDVRRCMQCCALLTYAIDSPVVVSHHEGNQDVLDASTFSETLRDTAFSTLKEYSSAVCEVASVAACHSLPKDKGLTSSKRVLSRSTPRPDHWCHYPWPPSDRVWRALMCYWSATLSVQAPGRILNFWRVLEAVTEPKQQRDRLFLNLPTARVAPIWVEVTNLLTVGGRNVDAARVLRRRMMSRRTELIKQYGDPKKALDKLRKEGRGKAVHADKETLEYDMAAYVGEQLRNAEVIQYFARVAIEEAWDTDK